MTINPGSRLNRAWMISLFVRDNMQVSVPGLKRALVKRPPIFPDI